MPSPTYPVFFTGSSGASHTTAVAQGGFVIDYPLGERNRDALMIRQQFQQKRVDYVRPAANLQNCSAYTNAYFCDDTGFRDLGMGLMEWTRVWATIPSQTIDYETFAYTFPGYAASGMTPGRVPISNQVTSKIVLDFYLVGSGGSYTSAADIPVTFGQTYVYGVWSGSVAAEYLNGDSVPTITTYKGWVTTDAATASSYTLEAHDSILEPYVGNIWRRLRRFVKAR